MVTAKIQVALARAANIDVVTDALFLLLSVLRKNGQVLGNSWPLAIYGRTLIAYVSLPTKTSLTSKHYNKYVRDARKALHKLCGTGFKATIVGIDPQSASPCQCRHRDSLILYTDYLCMESPLRCGSCFGPIPLYWLPTGTDGKYWRILAWQSDYAACDGLQMRTDTGEAFGMRELSRHDSKLSQTGRTLTREVEHATAIPAYYYLHKSLGRSARSECLRMCPACGKQWLLEQRLHDRFDFKCRRCRLLSNIACNVRQIDSKP